MSNTTLVQLPALRQSAVETAACPRAYVEIYINGKAQPDSIPSERGSEIHRIMSEYVRHCAGLGISSDWLHFNKLAAAAGPEAGPILDGIRDTYQVDHSRVYGTEITLELDEDFNPTTGGGIPGEYRPGLPGSINTGKDAAHIGTLDVILLNEDGTHAKIDDYKSHPAPFDADTFQGTLYPFMLFKHLPQLEVITFELNFVRYQNCLRRVQWKRTDMPEMQAIISRARERQRLTHEDPDAALALPGKTCAYCPLGKNFTCPIAEYNEYVNLSLEDRLKWKLWMTKMSALNNSVLKSHAEVTGPIRYEDGNGRVYEYGEMPVPQTRYPLDASAMQVLTDWKISTGEDLLDGRLNISSTKLKQLLKTKKRAPLQEQFEESCIETGTKPKYAVRTPEGIEEDFNPYAAEN